jgi:hypothetical protein
MDYNLGNDYSTNRGADAIEQFLKREFPEIIQRESKPHNVIFMPDTFIYKDLTEKVDFLQNTVKPVYNEHP